jgi:uncharacterized membrane protein YdjX (TVP38/TMEM64 family)
MESQNMQTPEEATMSPVTTTSVQRSSSFWSRNWQKVVAASIWVALVGSFLGYGAITGNAPTDTLRQLVELMQTPLGPLIYIFIYMLRPLAFFSAVVLTLLGGALFGPIFGVLYTVIGSNLSATIAYLLGFFLGKGMIDENQTEGIVGRYINPMRNNSFETILTMRFLFLPYDLVNYLGGILRVDYKAFILATILGSIPGTISFVLAGASVNVADVFAGTASPDFNPWTLVASALLFVAGIGISRYFKRREAARMKASTAAPEAPAQHER